MKNLYNYVDKKLLDGATKLVRTYNWTTGRTRADLANKFVTASTISGCLGATALGYNYQETISYIIGGIAFPFFYLKIMSLKKKI